MNASVRFALTLTMLSLLSGCGRGSSDGPPQMRLGDTVCDQCNMIISDVRWATATMVKGTRGTEPRLFDDFNCQVGYEVAHPELAVVSRWSHSYTTGEWIGTERAGFLMSPKLRTPMGSFVAAFGSVPEAEEARAGLPGDVMTFEIAWKRLGFAGACLHTEETEMAPAEQENDDGP